MFVQFDSGATPDGTYISCQLGPDCTWQRYLADGKGEELAGAGVTDGASFGRYFMSDVMRHRRRRSSSPFTLAGALVAAGFRSLAKPPADAPGAGHLRPPGNATDR